MKKTTLKSPYIKAIVKIGNQKIIVRGCQDDIFNNYPNQEIIVINQKHETHTIKT